MTYTDYDGAHPGSLARSRQPTSPERQSEGRLRTFGLDIGPCTFVPPQGPGYAQLVAIGSGVARLAYGDVRISITPLRAAWVPDGGTYGLELLTRCTLRILYVDSRSHDRTFGAVRMRPLLYELIERAVLIGYLDASRPSDSHLLAVIDDELRALSHLAATESLVLPRDPFLLAAVGCVMSALVDIPKVATLARNACMSVRTFERRFKSETGLVPREWLRRARLGRAAIRLTEGASVTEAALDCGYSSTSAFIAAYRLAFGVTPGRALR